MIIQIISIQGVSSYPLRRNTIDDFFEEVKELKEFIELTECVHYAMIFCIASNTGEVLAETEVRV